MSDVKAIQDYYPNHFSICYGCGRLNEHGYQLKTFWDGDITLTRFIPKPFHTAIPGYVYGGLLASIIDCHGTGSAALAYARENQIELKEENAPRFVTASLKVNYKKPTPIDKTLVVKGAIQELKGKKLVIMADLFAGDQLCVSGEVIAVRVPDDFMQS